MPGEQNNNKANNTTDFHGFVTLDPNLKRIVEQLKVVSSNQSDMLWITGEPGVGKSRLALSYTQEALSHLPIETASISMHALGKPFCDNDIGDMLLLDIPADTTLHDLLHFQENFTRHLLKRKAPLYLLCILSYPYHQYSLEVGHHLSKMQQIFIENSINHVCIPPLCERPLDIQLHWERFLSQFSAMNDDKHTNLVLQTVPNHVVASCLHENIRELKRQALEWSEYYYARPARQHQRPLWKHSAAQILNKSKNATQTNNYEPATASSHHIRLTKENGELRTMEALQDDIIAMACDYCEGSKSKAAKQLGLGRTTLYRKLKGSGT